MFFLLICLNGLLSLMDTLLLWGFLVGRSFLDFCELIITLNGFLDILMFNLGCLCLLPDPGNL